MGSGGLFGLLQCLRQRMMEGRGTGYEKLPLENSRSACSFVVYLTRSLWKLHPSFTNISPSTSTSNLPPLITINRLHQNHPASSKTTSLLYIGVDLKQHVCRAASHDGVSSTKNRQGIHTEHVLSGTEQLYSESETDYRDR